ncbi:MAG: hypothetical protein AAB849_00840 [Patescibacteria group bacterium]
MFKQNLEMQKIKPSSLFLQGWKLLAGKFGPLGADKFVSIARGGFGDSVQERKKMWKGRGLKGIAKLLES